MPKSEIITLTPNPTLDLGGCVRQLIPDEKNYVEDETRYPGGNGINAARMAFRMGAKVKATGFLGGGVGQEVFDLLKAENLPQDFVRISGNTRISITVSNIETNRQTRLSFSGPKISSEEFSALREQLQQCASGTLVVIGGSFPPGVDADHIGSLMDDLRAQNIRCGVDVPGKLLPDLVQYRPLFIKPNLLEFQSLVGGKPQSRAEVKTAAHTYTDRVSAVCVSSVDGGALLVTRNKAWFGRIPKIMVKTTVGAGDSMVGLMSHTLAEWGASALSDDELSQLLDERGGELLQWGLAGSTSTLISIGTELGQAEDVRKYYPQVHIEEA